MGFGYSTNQRKKEKVKLVAWRNEYYKVFDMVIK